MAIRWGFGSIGWAVAAIQTVFLFVLGLWWIPPPSASPPSIPILPGAPPSNAADTALQLCPACPTDSSTADFEETTWEKFRSWAIHAGIEVHPALAMQDGGPEGGRGIFAAVPVAANATLLRVPLKMMLTVPGCLAQSSLAAAVSHLWHEPERIGAKALSKTAMGVEAAFWQQRREEWRADDTLDSTILALCLLEENSKGEASSLAPWIAVLPREHRGAPLAMQKDELDTCLRGSSSEVHEAALRWRSTCLKDFLLLSHEIEGMRRFSFEDFLHYRLMVGSRTHGFKLPPDFVNSGAGGNAAGEATAIVPFADMFNHNNERRRARWKYDSDTHEFLVRAEFSGIAAGDEVTVTYGVKSDEEMFLFYGFSDSSAHREAKLMLDVDTRKDPLAYDKRELLMQKDLFRVFKLRSTLPMAEKDLANMLLTARIIAAETDEELQAVSAGTWTPELESRALTLLADTARVARTKCSAAEGKAPLPPSCAAFRDKEQELFAEVESFAKAAGSGASGRRRAPPAEPALPKWLHARVENYTQWYIVEAGGAKKD
eukprot:gnl/TRDRNA2_/TRDRNA2_80782_c0_seq1.p1 gnl/TRDRNA2_/TRDRNA2_80782_c0~~gnl/TRDRNA2_/TRDRNA2_80782_c0_seq1.p1  ORF type:complete len:545 (+),score=122.28 gnl/TRDRNA2_/TRDRNA2_80782_c0_seq1:95-1729(+)